MTWRSNTVETTGVGWITSRYAGLGVPSAEIPATGDNGAGYLYNDTMENGSGEYRGVILTRPSAGTFTTYETSALSFTSAPDGDHTATYRGYKDGVLYGDFTITMTIGGGATFVGESIFSVSADAGVQLFSSKECLAIPAVVVGSGVQFSSNKQASANTELSGSASVSLETLKSGTVTPYVLVDSTVTLEATKQASANTELSASASVSLETLKSGTVTPYVLVDSTVTLEATKQSESMVVFSGSAIANSEASKSGEAEIHLEASATFDFSGYNDAIQLPVNTFSVTTKSMTHYSIVTYNGGN